MSDGITEARRGTYFSVKKGTPGVNGVLNTQIDIYYDNLLGKVPIQYIEKYLRRKKLENINVSK